jgi:hypothetical protein
VSLVIISRTLDNASNTNGCLERAAASRRVELLALFFGLASGLQPSGVPVIALAQLLSHSLQLLEPQVQQCLLHSNLIALLRTGTIPLRNNSLSNTHIYRCSAQCSNSSCWWCSSSDSFCQWA